MESHNRSIWFNALVIGLTFFAVILLLLALLWPENSVSSEASADLTQYTAKSVGYQVVIYQTGHREPVLMTGIDIRTLPQADQAALSEGIPLQDAVALAHLLEDYDA